MAALLPESGHRSAARKCPLCAKSGLKIIEPCQEMARCDRCQLPAALESGVALLAGATSIADTALLSETPSPPNGLHGFPNNSFKALALWALESV